MKDAIIFHGSDLTPDHFWYLSIKRFLEAKGYSVWAPQLPDAKHPDIAKWLPFVLEGGTYTEETLLIGHSAGGPLILSVLEKISIRVKKVVLVGSFGRILDESDKLFVQDSYDWERIRAHAQEFVFINSDNDPWGCTDIEGRFLFDKLGGTQVIMHGQGHFGSTTYNQPYKEFPLLERLL